MRTDIGLRLLGSAGIGAGIMYLLDPNMGLRRRAILRDKVFSFGNLTASAADKTARDVKNRAYGIVASTKSKFGDVDISDDVLVERVRSKMGRAVSHPSSIYVSASDGVVTLSGPILSGEVNSLLHAVSGVRGVSKVRNNLDVHDEPGEISSLQGGYSRRGSNFSLLQSNWPPAIGLVVGSAGSVCTGLGIKQGGLIGSVLAGLGAGLIGMAVTNANVRDLVNRVSTKGETGILETLTESLASRSRGRTKQRNVA